MSEGWNTIESDAGVFTYLINNLGVKDVQFEELIALDADYLRQLSPVYGVIFLFKYPTGESRPKDSPHDGDFDHDAAQSLFFASQTIQNACGTQALLSVLLNKDDQVDIGDELTSFKDFTSAFPPELRGEALSNSDLIRGVHNSFARSSPFQLDQSAANASSSDDVYHFIAYLPHNDILYELDGLQPAPICHGHCSPAEFPKKIIPVLQRRIARYPATEIRFNLLACVGDLQAKAEKAGDSEGWEREQMKRRGWRWENALRRWNFVGFIGGLMEGVVNEQSKGGGKGYERWVEEAKKRTKAKREEGATE